MSSGCWRSGHTSNSWFTRLICRLLHIQPDVTVPIQELKAVTNKYEQRETLMVTRIKEKTDEARRLAAKSRVASGVERETLRRQAMMCLKSKAQLQEQLNRTVARHLAVDAQCLQLEDASLTADALSALRTSTRAMEAHGRHVDLERVQRLLDRLEGQMVDSAEMSEAFADVQLAPGSGMDEGQLESELDALLEDEIVVDMPVPGVFAPEATVAPAVVSSMRSDSTQTVDAEGAAPPEEVVSERAPLLSKPEEGETLMALRKMMAPSQ